jgi:hypothetical protein
MLRFLQWAFWVVGLGLQLLVLSTALQGVAREFPALFTYVVCLVGTTLADIVASQFLGKSSHSFKLYYWCAELVRQSALFAMVVSLAMHVVPPGRRSDALTRIIALLGAAVWLGSVIVCYSANLNVWMVSVIRNLSFFTGVLNLGVWFAYARSRIRDTRRLIIAAGLGLQMTGEAIGHAIRQLDLSNDISLAASIFIVLTHFLCLFLWWRALSTEAEMHVETAVS